MIHPTALVGSGARIGHDVTIGPFSVVEDDVAIGDGCRIGPHVVVRNGTELGPENTVDTGTVLGGAPQHARVGPRWGRVIIGTRNTIRENVTVHAAFQPGDVTRVGDNNLLMAASHVGHDAIVEHDTILANNVLLGGHSIAQHHAYLSGSVAVHQFCRVGAYAMVGGLARVVQDVPPYVMVDGYTSKIVGLNSVGLRRNGFDTQQIQELKDAYRVVYRQGLSWSEMLTELAARFPAGPAAAYRTFLLTVKRGIVQERRAPRGATLKLAFEPEEIRSQETRWRQAG